MTASNRLSGELRLSARPGCAFAGAAAVALADLATKEIVQANLAYAERIPVNGFFNLVNVLGTHNVLAYTVDNGESPPVLRGFSQLPFLPTIGVRASSGRSAETSGKGPRCTPPMPPVAKT